MAQYERCYPEGCVQQHGGHVLPAHGQSLYCARCGLRAQSWVEAREWWARTEAATLRETLRELPQSPSLWQTVGPALVYFALLALLIWLSAKR